MVNDLNVFPEIDLHDLTTDPKHWFKAMPMYLSMQREIEEYNSEWPHQRRPKRKKRKRKKTKGKWKRKRNQMLDNPDFRPLIRNLVVVPMCDFRRTQFRIDCTSMRQVLSSQKLLPKVEIENKKGTTSTTIIPEKDFNRDRDYWWNQYFYMRKIRRFVRGKKQFDFSINTDGISVSLQYSAKKKTDNKETDQKSRIIRKIEDGTTKNFSGVDTGVRSWNTTTTHDIETGKETNFVMSSKQFHWQTGQKVRNAKAKRWTKNFVEMERADRENRELYPVMPSPKGSMWLNYIKHRVKMMKHGICAYSTAKYTRLALDKHIKSSSVVDEWVNKVTDKKPTLFFFGADGEIPPDSPISIKKHVRCPGVRKTLRSIKKRRDCFIQLVDEWGTSQTDARCMNRFQNQNKAARFKKCRCVPDARTLLPTKIVSKLGKTDLSIYRQLQRAMNEEASEEDECLFPKVKCYYKNWRLNLECSVIWHRDVVAAKNILLKGLWTLLGLPIPEAINRYWCEAVEAAAVVAAAAAARATAEAAAAAVAIVDNDVEMFEYDQQPADHAV
ncbi:uncharacterized protein LOC129571447 isoform X2 [Sitodiplosis mosellana]|uniref:uncharacterized protein LOC129571447 isoform X2 n=1 Tax=Sitodiplosis mosellana TaxID=263140 RepID=UPI0024439DFB|nr:uncharacterized protein LOC129571447 isoform X2 [Sitodiplosis mosellana]